MVMSVQSDETFGQMVRVLAEPLRLRILGLLADEELCTCHIVEETGARQSNVSNHLRALKEAGLVVSEPSGRYTYYRLVPEAVQEVAEQLATVAARARSTAGVRRPSCD